MSNFGDRKIPTGVPTIRGPQAPPAPVPQVSSGRLWSEQQQAIFENFKLTTGHTVVRARAGTGKTTTLLEGLRYTSAQRILLAAFNKIIAGELKARVPNSRCEAKTLHALGFGCVIKQWAGVQVDDKRGWDLAVKALGKDNPRSVVTAIKNLHTKLREVMPHETDLQAVIDLAVRFDILPEAEDEQKYSLERVCQLALLARNLAMEASETIDFADMIFLPLVHGWVTPQYDMVVVDEAQDMTGAQLELAMKSCKVGGRIIVVGDDRQAIYAFRGADSGSLDRLKAELHATELGLTTTYRCPKLVVEQAREWVMDFHAAESAPEGVVKTVEMEECLKNASVGDFVLSRTNAPLVSVCVTLLRRGVRARIRGRDIGKQILSLIKKWDVDTLEEAQEQLERWAKRERMRASRLPEEVRGKRFMFIEEQQDLIASLMEGVETINAFKDRVETLFADEDGAKAVMCSTVHKAKGLEADRVWLLRETFKSGLLEEENIRYVAITRAKQELYWVEKRGE